MTIKRQWLTMLTLIAVLSVVITTLVLSLLTNQYFKGYVRQNYEKHYNQIIDYVTTALQENDMTQTQMEAQLEAHLADPIIRIKVYDSNGNLKAEVGTDPLVYVGGGMMRGMMGRMMGRARDARYEEVEHADIKNGDTVIGQVNITSYSAAEDSIATWMFQSSLFKNSLYSIGIVLLLAVIAGILVSRRMSRDLVLTSLLAQSADIGEETQYPTSKVKEIRIIQQSLELLRARLKLRQKSRKALIDELVHQARTPLTILRTHLEGLEDGVIEMGPEEVKICENQIENITAIITNMSSLIDAETPAKSLKTEEFELGQLLRQIVNGLRAQFDKKAIDLQVTDQEKVILNTDKYKLSQTIYNLLTNAYKFTPSNGKVMVYYTVTPDRVVLSIEDNGPGIEKADQARIFDAYYRKDTGTGTAGDGIGLFIAKENMSSINGAISVQSERNKGSRFILTIPR